MEAVLGHGADGHEFRAARGDDALIGRVIGIGHQDVAVFLGDGHHRGEERGLGAGQEGDLLGRDLVAGAAACNSAAIAWSTSGSPRPLE